VTRLGSLRRNLLRLFAALVGLGLFSYLIFRTGPALIWTQFQAVGWGLVSIIALGGVSQLVLTCAWRQTFTCDITPLSWSRSIGVQLISDGAGQLGFAGKLLGDALRVSLLPSAVPLPSGISAAAIDGGLHVLTAAVITVLGIVATLLVTHLSGPWRAYGLILAILLMSVVILAAVSVANRWPLMGNVARTIGRVPVLRNWVSAKQPIIDSAEHNLLEYYRVAPASFWKALALHFLWHGLAVLEVLLILRLMGSRVGIMSAFVVESLTKVINLVGVLNPGNLGTYEVGNMLIAKSLRVSSTIGLTLALCRRARSVFWGAVGAGCMVLMKSPGKVVRGAAAS
jgi:Lysylphosphatidylglycerol synthase TM region